MTGPSPSVVIAAAHIDSSVSYEPDEAIQLWNSGESPQPLAGWTISTASRHATFPVTTTLTLPPGQGIWCAAEDTAFLHSFGQPAACAWDLAEAPTTEILDGGLTLSNGGGTIQLRNDRGKLMDALLYGDADQSIEGWVGPPAQAYARGDIGAEGQVWRRKTVATSARPQDTDSAGDWAGDVADIDWGRRVYFPGWDLGERALPYHGEDNASVRVAVAPEGLFASMNDALLSAQSSLDLNFYVFEHPQLAQTIAGLAQRGVRIRLLLEGSPAGGISDLQRWCVATMAAAGADIRYLAATDDAPNGYAPRYRYAHAKFGIVDGVRSFVGTENLTWDSAPVASGEPAGGRRGYYLFTDATSVAQELSRIFESDWRPETFLDLRPYEAAHPKYGGPPDGYVLPEPPKYWVDSAPFASAITASGQGHFVVVSAPENAMRPDDGLFALLDRAGPGDEILVEQLYEHKYWGDSTSNPVADPNPRLERLIAAARRGATVRVLLDSLFDDADGLRSNRATVDYLNAISTAENLDLAAAVGNPTGGGIHAKLILVRVGGESWSAVGSLNGGEVSHKVNREVVLMVDHLLVYNRLFEVFQHDWALTLR